MTVAPRTPSTIGVNRFIWCFVITLSTRYLVEAGSTNPETRLIPINTKPSASKPRRGFINAQTSGRLFQAFFFFLSLAAASPLAAVASLVSVAIRFEDNSVSRFRCRRAANHYTGPGEVENAA